MAKLHRMDDGHYAFHCPGCECAHLIPVAGSVQPVWGWNKSIDAPTFTPSIRVTFPANPDAVEEFREWRKARCCHSFVTDGKIAFLGDSTHKLSGMMVLLPEWG